METLEAIIPISVDFYARFLDGEESESEYIKHEIRKAKHDLIEKLLEDSIYHGRYWLIRFDEYMPTRRDMYGAWETPWSTINYRVTVSVSEVPHEQYHLPSVVWDEPEFVVPADKTTDFIKYKFNQIKRRTKWRVREWASKIRIKT